MTDFLCAAFLRWQYLTSWFRLILPRLAGLKTGKRIRVGSGIHWPWLALGRLHLEDGVTIGNGVKFFLLKDYPKGRIEIGPETVIGDRCVISAIDSVSIGYGCQISYDVRISDHVHAFMIGFPAAVDIGARCCIGRTTEVEPGGNDRRCVHSRLAGEGQRQTQRRDKDFMNNAIASLVQSTPARRFIRGTRLHKLINAWLSVFPRVGYIGCTKYRSTRTESVSLALEMLETKNAYNVDFLPAKTETFCDLGCNVGYFPCLLSERAPGGIKGLMIDANMAVIKDAEWHKKQNGWDDVFIYNGMVGNGKHGDDWFHIYGSDTLSRKTLPWHGRDSNVKRTKVPTISVEELWKRHFGNLRCDVLKLDIEGAELDFVKSEPEFLKRVGTIFMEVHQQYVNLGAVKNKLAKFGFEPVFIQTGDQHGDISTVFKNWNLIR